MSNLDAVGQAVCTHLIAAEKASDTFVHDTAALNVTLIEARRIGRLRAVHGQRAMSDIARAHELSVQARACLVRAHSRLAGDATALGLDWTMWGDEADTPQRKSLQIGADPQVEVASGD